MSKQRIVAHGLARPSGNDGETKPDRIETGSKRWCNKGVVRRTEILIIGRTEECLCPRNTSHKGRTLHNNGSCKLMEAVLVFHLGRDLPSIKPCHGSSGRWAMLAAVGRQLPWAAGAVATACLAVWQPLLSTVPLPPLGALCLTTGRSFWFC